MTMVHQNPVKAGICVKAEEYTWSSWQEYLNDDGILPTLCYTKAVLKRITLDNLKELVDETLDGDITDVEYTTDDRLTDDDIRQYLRGHWHLEHPTDLQKKEKTDRNEILIEAIQYGAPLRQLSRLTGISYGVIQRINGKMKLGQLDPPDFLTVRKKQLRTSLRIFLRLLRQHRYGHIVMRR